MKRRIKPVDVIDQLFRVVVKHYSAINRARAQKLLQMAREGRIVISLEKGTFLGLKFRKNYVITERGVTTKFFLPKGEIAHVKLPFNHLFTKDGRLKWSGVATFIHELTHVSQPRMPSFYAEVEADLTALGILLRIGKAAGKVEEAKRVAREYIKGRPHLRVVSESIKKKVRKKRKSEISKLKKVRGS